MGKIWTAWKLRLQRALKLVATGAVSPNGSPEHWLVRSQSGRGGYDVCIRVDQEEQPGFVLDTYCSCPDWSTQNLAMWDAEAQGYRPDNPGISQIDYCPACKHVLSVLLETGVIDGHTDARLPS